MKTVAAINVTFGAGFLSIHAFDGHVGYLFIGVFCLFCGLINAHQLFKP